MTFFSNLVFFLVISLLIGIGTGGAIVYFVLKQRARTRRLSAESEAQAIIAEAELAAQEVLQEARDEALRIRDEVEREMEKRRRDLYREDDRLRKRREQLDHRFEKLEEREARLNKRQSQLDRQRSELEKLKVERLAALERVAEMTRDEAREHLLNMVEEEARNDMARRIREVEDELSAEADERARELIALAIQRVASDYVADVTISVVPLPSDEMKGRIIGRNGRNIRAFEQASGVDVIVDDTPEAVTISSFDPVRREVARRALERLVQDGRIHPARIEKLILDVRKEVEAIIREEGERAAYDAGVAGLHPEVIKMLGRLKFRTSFGQQQLAHAVETARLAGVLASELGANVEVAKAGGLLHDIGKAMDHEIEGTHALIGAEFCRRYGVPEAIVNCIESHHHEVEQRYVEAIIVEAADAISGARPGARRESLESYLKRVRTLEEIANSFEGVSQSYALQAGREVRIIVKPDDIDDLAAIRLSKDIARKIEDSMQYPGQIKVTVIRETRAVDYAK
ncbi:MAG TPA: ribonuclease Y [Chloroflexi bacterium]|nr:ribonuclease Y [Chloroflexota bacterium]